MSRRRIVMAVSDGCENAAERLRTVLLSSDTLDSGALDAHRALEIGAAELDQADVLVMLAPGTHDPLELLHLLSLCEEMAIAVVALIDLDAGPIRPYASAGALVLPHTSEDVVVLSSIEALVHRQAEVRRLHNEVSLANRFHGGLRGEIDRIHEELQLAAMVQREFLPRHIPDLHGIHCAALWRPANYVSGDIYDITRLDDDHLGIFLADAVGHGVPAALMTMVICRSLVLVDRSGAAPRILPPSEVLARLNSALINRQGRNTRFATAVYGVIDCRSRVLTIAGAGHPPALRLRKGQDPEPLETDGGLLGVFPDEVFSQIDVELAIDDRLVLYSDGFEQAFPSDKNDQASLRLPTRRYLAEFERLIDSNSALAMVEELAMRVDAQAGSLHQVDDLTFLSIHAGPLECSEPAPADRRQGRRGVLPRLTG